MVQIILQKINLCCRNKLLLEESFPFFTVPVLASACCLSSCAFHWMVTWVLKHKAKVDMFIVLRNTTLAVVNNLFQNGMGILISAFGRGQDLILFRIQVIKEYLAPFSDWQCQAPWLA